MKLDYLLTCMISKLKMVETLLSEIMLEEKLVELWPDHGCLYDYRCLCEFPGFRKTGIKVMIEEIATKLAQNGM